MTTLKDVAQKAGVSIKTASRVLNNEAHVARATREKVRAAMEVLDFRPNLSARTMRTGKSGMVGIITHQALKRPWSSEIMSGLFQGLEQAQKQPLITQISDYAHMEQAVRLMQDQSVDGIIYTAMYHHGIDLPEIAYNLPFVVCNSYDKQQKASSVVPDDYLGGTLAVQHLLERGYTRIGYLGLSKVDAGLLRGKAFKDCLAAANIPLDPMHFEEGDRFSPNESTIVAYEKLEYWWQQKNMPQAIVAGNDQMAMVIMEFAQRYQLRIPTDLAIMGYDNHIPIAQFMYPKLSTIDIAYHAVGQNSAYRLIQLLEEETSQQEGRITKIPAQLVIRQST